MTLLLALALADPEACADCHPDEVEQWRGSRHGTSWTNAHFQRSLEDAAMKSWCVGCHRPTPSGVGCELCHAEPHGAEAEAPTVEGCLGCHQFQLPDRHPMASPVPMQDTGGEWARHGGDESCIDCHFDGTHALPGAHDPDFVRSAIRVSPRVEGARVVFEIATRGVGHRVPTGDPFRRMVLQVCADRACAQVLEQREIGRQLGGMRLTEVRDTRLVPDAIRRFEVPLQVRSHWWQLRYHLAEPWLEPLLPPVERGYVVAEGPVFSDQARQP